MAICYEATEAGAASAIAQNEPDDRILSALEFIMIEDIDHLYRFSNLYQYSDETPADWLVRNLLEIFPADHLSSLIATRSTLSVHQLTFQNPI